MQNDMTKQDQEMLQEVAFRNAMAKYRAMSKTATLPEVGIFWIDAAGTMFAESVSIKDAEGYDEFKIFGGSHYDLWRKAVHANPQWKELEYEEIPRGRVVWHNTPKDPEFVVYLPKELVRYQGQVTSKFNLPSGHVRFDTTDEHYRMCDVCNR
jgi:hypothetical protein